jgi:peroxiredoxin Q/BCP
MAQLRQDHAEFVASGAEVVIVGPDNAEAFQEYFSEHDLPFVGLPDPEHRVLRLFGQQVNLFKAGRMPAQVVIDQQGIARYAHYGHSMSDIPENSEILEILRELHSEAFSAAAPA